MRLRAITALLVDNMVAHRRLVMEAVLRVATHSREDMVRLHRANTIGLPHHLVSMDSKVGMVNLDTVPHRRPQDIRLLARCDVQG